MKKNHTVRTFVTGFLAAVLLVGVVPSAVAAATGRSITIYPGISIFIDDKKLNPTDANGKPVEVFTFNGTTYLPVRAVSEALGKPVQWVGSTRSVYVGKHSGTSPAEYLSQKDYFAGTSNSNFYTAATQQDNTGATHAYCITRNFDRTYILNGQYTRLTGMLYQTYDYRSETVHQGDGVTIYGDGKVLCDVKAPERLSNGGFMPQQIDVDLTGVLQLRVVFESYYSYEPLALGDMGLWT